MSSGAHDHPEILAAIPASPDLTSFPSDGDVDGMITAAIKAHEARMHAPVIVVPPPVVVPPPQPTGNVATFNAGGSQSAFWALMADQALDGIVMRGASYAGWGGDLNIVRSKPLLVTPAPGETVVFTGGGGGLFLPGWNGGHCTGIAFRGPGFEITGRSIGAAGIIQTGYAEHVEFSGFKVRSCTGTGAHSQTSHVIYVSTAVLPGGGTVQGTLHGADLTFNDWDVSPGSTRSMSFLQCYHAPQVHGLVARRNKVDSVHWGFVGRHDAVGLDITDWIITNTDISFDSQGPAGTVKRMKASSSGAPVISAPMVQGTGADANVWS